MSATLLHPVADKYLRETFTLKPGDPLHRLVARLTDTYYDDLTDERIEEIERHVDQLMPTSDWQILVAKFPSGANDLHRIAKPGRTRSLYPPWPCGSKVTDTPPPFPR